MAEYRSAKRKPFSLNAEQMDRVVRKLFPMDPTEDFPLFTIKKLKVAVLSMKDKKTPGPDVTLAEICKLMFHGGE